MAIAIVFTPPAMNPEQYDEIIRRLDEAGASAPPGRLYHACYRGGNQLNVFDVWDSRESFERFGQTLMPILQQVGVNPGQPVISEIHNIIEG
jgi:hypothetical protein